jgi:hypothetical protein
MVDADAEAAGQGESEGSQVVCLLVGVLEFESELLEEHGHQCHRLCDRKSLAQAAFIRGMIEEKERKIVCEQKEGFFLILNNRNENTINV